MNKYILKIDGGLEFTFDGFADALKMAETYLAEKCRVSIYMMVWNEGVLVNGKK